MIGMICRNVGEVGQGVVYVNLDVYMNVGDRRSCRWYGRGLMLKLLLHTWK